MGSGMYGYMTERWSERGKVCSRGSGEQPCTRVLFRGSRHGLLDGDTRVLLLCRCVHAEGSYSVGGAAETLLCWGNLV